MLSTGRFEITKLILNSSNRKKWESQKALTKNEKGGMKLNFIPILKKKCIQKKENDKRTVFNSHHVATFGLQTALPLVTGDSSSICYKTKHFT